MQHSFIQMHYELSYGRIAEIPLQTSLPKHIYGSSDSVFILVKQNSVAQSSCECQKSNLIQNCLNSNHQ